MDTDALYSFYRRHIDNVLLPFWRRAVDHRRGGIYTCFSNNGETLVSTDKYSWSQGRFLWIWARLARMMAADKLGGDPGPYLEQLRRTAAFLEDNVFLGDGHCAFLLTEAGEKKESIPGKGYDTSIYADCFVALGLAAYAGLTNDQQRFNVALALYDNIRGRLSAGNFRSEPYPIPEGYRAHAIPMIMLNVTQELAEAAQSLGHGRQESLGRHAVEYMDDIMGNFRQTGGRIVEMLPASPSEDDTLLGRHGNPGHALESMWFVLDTAQTTGNNRYIRQAIGTVKWAINVGWDQPYGGLLRFVDNEGGRPKGTATGGPYEQLVTGSWETKLWWPHSEALYATLRCFLLSGDRQWWSLYEKVATYVFDTFPNPDKQIGEWIQIRDRRGRPVDRVVALPVKDPFHILRDMLLILDLLENRETSQEGK